MRKIFNILLSAFLSIFIFSCDLGITGDNGWKSAQNGGGSNYKGAKIIFDSYEFYSDDNGDNIINPGETIRLYVNLKNTGASDAQGVKVKFSSKNEYISDLSTNVFSYGSIYAGAITNTYSIIQFKVSKSTPAETEIVINIDIEDNNGNKWTDSFKIIVQSTGAKIAFYEYEIYSDDNNDKIINPGETIRLYVDLKNIGTSTAQGVKAKFSSENEYISDLSTNVFSYGSIYAGAATNTYTTMQFKVSTSATNVTEIIINIDIEDDKGNKWTDSFKVIVQSTGAKIAFYEYEIYLDDNNDKIINPGETIRLYVDLKNIGTSTAQGVKAKFTSSSVYISDLSTSVFSYGNISAGATTNTYTTMQFKVSASAPNGAEIVIDIEIVDDKGNKWFDNFKLVVQSEMPNIVFNSTKVLDDNNWNGKIEKGETITLEVSLKNIGVVDANAVNAQFSSISSYISGLTSAAVFYGTISAKGNTAKSILFTIAGNTPSQTKIPIDINITDGNGNSWTQQFEILVQ